MQRYLFGGAQPGELDRQGRVALPAPLLAARAAGQGHRHRRPAGPARDLGPRSLAPPARRGRRERRECCRTSCPVQALTRTYRCSRARSVALLDVHPGELIVDCTFGAGGHSRLLARDLDGSGELVAIDRDPTHAALRRRAARDGRHRRADPPDARRRSRAACAACSTRAPGRRRPDGSRHVVDAGRRARRGFSYTQDAPLDMRMDPSDEITAATLVNEWGERELAQIFHRYGEERFSRQIARAIVQERVHDAVRDDARSSSRRSSAPSRRPRASGTGIPPSASSRRCGSPSTTSSGSSRTASRARSSCASPAGASGRDRLPLARGSHRQAALRRRPPRAASARPTCPSAAAVARRSSGSSRAGPCARRRGGRGQSARGLGAPARRAARGDGVSAVAAPRSTERERERQRTRRCGARRRASASPRRS